MNTRKLAAYLTLVWLTLPGAAAQAEQGWYLGATLGTASMDEQFDDLTLDDSSSSFRVFGGWQFNPHVAVEAGYLTFGEFQETLDINGTTVNAALDADGFTLAARGSWPISSTFSIEPRLGVYFWDGNADVNGVSSADPGDTNLFFGLGLAAQVSDALALTADWTQYRLKDDATSVSVDVLSLGLRISLGSRGR